MDLGFLAFKLSSDGSFQKHPPHEPSRQVSGKKCVLIWWVRFLLAFPHLTHPPSGSLILWPRALRSVVCLPPWTVAKRGDGGCCLMPNIYVCHVFQTCLKMFKMVWHSRLCRFSGLWKLGKDVFPSSPVRSTLGSKAVKDHLPRRWAGVMAVGVGNTAKKLDLVIKRLHVLKAPKARIENNIKQHNLIPGGFNIVFYFFNSFR